MVKKNAPGLWVLVRKLVEVNTMGKLNWLIALGSIL